MQDLLNSNDDLTRLVRSNGIFTWKDLLSFVKNLPFGRNSNRGDFSLVLKEQKGTCSSKHALLKIIADLNDVSNVHLILATYKMNHLNTPGIGDGLITNKLDFIPEHHCFIRWDEVGYDCTTKESKLNNIEKDIIIERVIEPSFLINEKPKLHQVYLKEWIKDKSITLSLDEIWAIREECILNLSS